MMRIALTPPVQCSVCFQQKPEEEHVDMESAYDGPILDVSGARLSIDNIVLCAECVRAAGKLLPEQREQAERISHLEAINRNTLDYVSKVQNGMNELREALDIKLEQVLPAAPKRPAARGPVKVKV